ncbi:DNA cytosine methyltransferase [[Mycoplasma] anseris]|uniref:Uncharacterized protein n=1 Tax=[Mycoplasma] anseris TaxID=92400 RepID=A0A2Z4NDX5_9BACT|nr:DNA cytosine methyltransferase [[Mycoplasma] anseris]AWX69706.1 hypothetical protein DP065_03050 [[Mycoplasma] anseris]
MLFFCEQNQKIRKLPPRKYFNFQRFPKEFKLPEIANSHLYKQAGNSVSVSVIKRIALKLKEVLEKERNE